MDYLNIIKCSNEQCDFNFLGECLYGGTAKTIANPTTENECKAYEPYTETN